MELSTEKSSPGPEGAEGAGARLVAVCESCVIVVAYGDMTHLDGCPERDLISAKAETLLEPAIGDPRTEITDCYVCGDEVTSHYKVSARVAVANG